MAADGDDLYPPLEHFLRDLVGWSTWRAENDLVLAAELSPEIATAAGGAPIGFVAALVDIAGAQIALAAVRPDWVATADLTVQGGDRPVSEGPIVVRARTERMGSRLVVVRCDVLDGRGSEDPDAGRRAGTAVLTFSRIPGSATAASIDTRPELGVRRTLLGDDAPSGHGFDRPLRERLGIEVRAADAVDAGVDGAGHGADGPAGSAGPPGASVWLPRSAYVSNSFGTVNGGVSAMVVDAAAEVAAGPDHVTTDLTLRYVSQAGPGPLRTVSRVVARRGDSVAVEVELRDTSRDDALIAVGHVTCASFASLTDRVAR